MRVELTTPKSPAAPRGNAPSGGNPPGSTTVFIGGLSDETTDDHIHELLKDCGAIKQIRWVTDKESGKFKGYLLFSSTLLSDADLLNLRKKLPLRRLLLIMEKNFLEEV